MTTRNLDSMFRPASVALIGASQKPASMGAVLARNLFGGGFKGDIYPVNPKYPHIAGVASYPDISSLPKIPELAVIATPPDTVPGLIGQLGEFGTKAAVVITAGFGEGGSEKGQCLCKAMLEGACPHLLRIMGPNCLGIMVPGIGLNASFGHIQPLTGKLAFVAQSGAVLTSILDWATYRQIGFSHFVSLGDMADVDFGDMLDYLTSDYRTSAILMYVEAVTHARKFMSAARAAARIKPVIVVKAGRHVEGARAAVSHTGALAGTDAVYDAAFRRAGILRVTDMQALFDAVQTLAMARPVAGDRLAILTNGGGIGVLATDVLIDRNGRLADLSPESLEALNAVLPTTWSHGNPVDIIGDADGSRYAAALEVLLNEKNLDAILILNCPAAIASSTDAAQAVIDTLKKHDSRYKSCGIFTNWLGDGTAEPARKLFTAERIPSYTTPTEAVRGFMQMVRYRHNQEMLMQTPPNIPEAFTPDTVLAQRTVDQALSEKRDWLNESEAKLILSAYGIPVVSTKVARTPEEAASLAADFGQTVALKILSPDITHKSDAGGVVLDLDTPERVFESAGAMAARIHDVYPQARIEGYTVQPMVRYRHGRELIIGMVNDAQFGPVILFGHGGIAVEVIQDKALALPPLNMNLAREVMHSTRIYRLLKGYRGMPAADLEGIALTLLKVSQLVSDLADVDELDINPLLADEKGVVALDARIRIARSMVPASQRLAIRPYPRELEESVQMPDGSSLLLRPIRPEDEPALHRLFSSLSREEIRMRFLHPMKFLSHEMAARLTQIDYDREMALVLVGQGSGGDQEHFGGVRIAADPDNERAEFAILLRGDVTGMGLGPMLMRRIINYARDRGIREIHGDVLSENKPMREICKAFGFKAKPVAGDPGVLNVSLSL